VFRKGCFLAGTCGGRQKGGGTTRDRTTGGLGEQMFEKKGEVGASGSKQERGSKHFQGRSGKVRVHHTQAWYYIRYLLGSFTLDSEG